MEHLGHRSLDEIRKLGSSESRYHSTMFNHYKVSRSTAMILREADAKTKHYGQSFMNEGHLIQSLLELDDPLEDLLTEEVKNGVINIACVPRDMIVNLNHLTENHSQLLKNAFRRAAYSDMDRLKKYIRDEFGERWLKHIDAYTGEEEEIPIFIAFNNKKIIGFACYDLVRNKKGLFGPMGTSHDMRGYSIGKTLLYICLKEMADQGYEYAVIGEAGPIEFYEKACHAALIPLFERS